MITCRKMLCLVALTALLGWPTFGAAQEPGKTSDEALDSLLEKLEKPGKESKPDAGTTPAQKAKPDARSKDSSAKTKPDAKPKTASGKPSQEAKAPRQGSGEVSGKDKEIDDLLEKLGETKDQPAPEERRPGLSQEGQPGQPPRPGGGRGQQPRDMNKPSGLQGPDKDLDERLEELTGKKKKRNSRQQQGGSGPLGQIIKEMRDVEQRLGKPETGEDTQSKQKKIVKDLETLIEQMRQSGGGSGSMALRMVRQAGQKPGNQQGQTPGSTPGGAPAQKPAKPSDHHAMAGGKDIWGHLPAELRQEMENVFKEEPLSAKMELIRRYYLSVAKQKTNRGN